MTQGSIYGANNAFNESTNDYSSYIQGGVNDVLTNNTLVHELPSGCMYGNPACGDGYYCNDQNVCVPIVSALLYGYVFDYSGFPISGATVSVVGGDNSSATTNAAGYYSLSAAVSQPSGQYPVVASKAPATTQSSATVNLTVGYASSRNFTLGYNPASFSGYIRDPSSVGIGGANVSCGSYSATTASDGSYSFGAIPMSAATSSCTLSASKSPACFSNSTTVSFGAGVATVQDLQLQYAFAAVAGFVRDPSGSGIAGANVSCAGQSNATAGDGSYSISGMPVAPANSTCALAASKPPAFTPNSKLVPLVAGAVASGQDIQLSYANAVLGGTVKDTAGTAIAGANISCGAYYSLSNATGIYSLSVPMANASASCTLNASKLPTYTTQAPTVALNAGQATNTAFTFAYANAILTVVLRDPLGTPAASKLSLSPADSTEYSESTGTHTYSIPMTASTKAATLSARCYYDTSTRYSEAVTLTAGVNLTRSIQYSSYCNSLLAGTVQTPVGTRVSGATVTCGSAATTSASDGSYSLYVPLSAATGSCSASAAKARYATDTRAVALTQNSQTTQNFAMPVSPAVIYGYVRDQSNNPVSGAKLRFYTTYFYDVASVTTDSGGYYSITLPVSYIDDSFLVSVYKTPTYNSLLTTLPAYGGQTTQVSTVNLNTMSFGSGPGVSTACFCYYDRPTNDYYCSSHPCTSDSSFPQSDNGMSFYIYFTQPISGGSTIQVKYKRFGIYISGCNPSYTWNLPSAASGWSWAYFGSSCAGNMYGDITAEVWYNGNLWIASPNAHFYK